MTAADNFFSIYSHGFVRVAVCVPPVRLADPHYNLTQTVAFAARAAERQALVALYPELNLSAYSNDDLFHQDALLDGVLATLTELLEASRELLPLLLVGAPLRVDGLLFNCAVAVYRGRLLGVIPKSYLPGYREFYEPRLFAAARQAARREIELLGQRVAFGTDLLFEAGNVEHFALAVEVCEDLWVPVPPSNYAALAGATVLANLSASNVTIGKAEYRRELCRTQSARCVAAYLYAAAGLGESSNDLAWDGQALVCENGELLAEGERFKPGGELITADIDLERLTQERTRLTSFADCAGDHRERLAVLRRVRFNFDLPQGEVTLRRAVDRFPYVPNNPTERDERCFEAYHIQVHGLLTRLQASGIDKLVIGVSGGLDSTHALIVAAKTVDLLDLPRSNILAYTMPGFATSDHTLSNAHALMRALEVNGREIDIRPSCLQMFNDIGHPFRDGEPVYDVTFENVQAGERTSHLFRLANQHGGLVLGTGDLSELALGWATYGVGDHMSHYAVNASVPKTLIQHLIRWVIHSGQFGEHSGAGKVLESILATEISPELIPGDAGSQPAQSTEDIIGPYALQDFNLYYATRFGLRPSKIAFLSHAAWHDPARGDWPVGMGTGAGQRPGYDLPTIKRWLEVFLKRFFQTSQFKRTCIPNGPKVGSGGSLSPRGDWRAPSDVHADLWLEELRRNVP